jgi:hypothetical protein
MTATAACSIASNPGATIDSTVLRRDFGRLQLGQYGVRVFRALFGLPDGNTGSLLEKLRIVDSGDRQRLTVFRR